MTPPRRLSFLVLTLLTLPLAAIPLQEAPRAKRVLIVTGSDVPAHDWRATTPVTRRILEEAKKLEVFVSEDTGVLESSALSRYDLIVLNYRNDASREKLSEAARKNLAAFVSGGKGLAAIHFAVAAESDWAEFQKLVGRTWVGKRSGEKAVKASGHGKRGPFKVIVTKKDHPITRGIQDFEADDELYAQLAGDGPIEVLATAHSADFSKRDEPMAWTLRYGEGRVFVTVLGHDVPARESEGFRKLLSQGCEWAAGAAPTPGDAGR
ncbi:MAG TPA: ThuA domain-containing protein [Planctomycetota bacterium]|nr:ThuA domain-containing protein [Planctomycetota bacterium]